MLSVRIRNRTYLVETAVTPEELERGLSGRASLKPGTGMLFVFATADIWAIWMKDTPVSLDILWIDDDGTVVHTASLPACRGKTFEEAVPPEKSRYVLEVSAGEIAFYGFSIGDSVTIS
jgi:uncharacterized membrane protein (UPF0127 family)